MCVLNVRRPLTHKRDKLTDELHMTEKVKPRVRGITVSWPAVRYRLLLCTTTTSEENTAPRSDAYGRVLTSVGDRPPGRIYFSKAKNDNGSVSFFHSFE